jgi:cobalt-zinc-cadmium resistance protein CzcA
MIVAPVLASFLFRKGAKEWINPIMTFLIVRYRKAATWAIRQRVITVGVGAVGFAIAIYLAFGGVIGSEFLPHLDEGSLWVRGTLEQSAGIGT